MGNFKKDTNTNYYSQEYKVECDVDLKSFTVYNTYGFPSDSKVTDLSGNNKTTFSKGENFKIMIPKEALNNKIDGEIYIQTKAKTFPVFYARTPENQQDYAVVTDPYGSLRNNVRLNVDVNKSTIVINKKDAETKENLKGVTFEVRYLDNTMIGTFTTDSNGKITINNLHPGEVKIIEKSTLKEYILDTTQHNVVLGLEDTQTITLDNTHKKGNVKVYKVDNDNHEIRLGNVQFELYSEEFKKVVGTYTTDVNGEFIIQNLRTGKYKLIEKNSGKWYNLAPDTQIEIEWNATKEYEIENELKKGQVKVVKVDKDNVEIKLEGVVFEILDKNNNVIERIVTNKNGEAITSKYPIRDFSELKLRESKTLDSYKLNETIQTVKLKENDISTITLQNEKKKGQIKVVKIDKDNNEIKLEGVTFEIYDVKGNKVDTMITNELGECTSKRLPIDQEYTIKETKTGEWYILNSEIKKVVLEEDKINTITFENEKKKGQIKVVKIDTDNNEIRVPNVTFEIYDAKGNKVDTMVTNELGECTSKRLPIDQEYTIRETKTNSEYVLNSETQKVVLEEDKINTLTIENKRIMGQIKIIKVSKEDNKYSELEKGANLEGAVFQILDKNNEVVDEITTKADGIAVSKLLYKDKYFIKEISAPNFYILNNAIFEVEIQKNEEIVEVIIENDNVELNVEINKVGYKETQSKDNIYYSFSNIHNNSNVYFDTFIWKDKLPTNALKIDKILTGTWNEKLEYSVWYKTNLNEYKILQDKLDTQTIYKLDFNNIELQENEYVTEYEFRFNNVKPDFREIESPRLYCTMFENIGNGFIFTNETTVTGTYHGKTVEANDKWTTITYFKEIEINNKLPRTRYVKILRR